MWFYIKRATFLCRDKIPHKPCVKAANVALKACMYLVVFWEEKPLKAVKHLNSYSELANTPVIISPREKHFGFRYRNAFKLHLKNTFTSGQSCRTQDCCMTWFWNRKIRNELHVDIIRRGFIVLCRPGCQRSVYKTKKSCDIWLLSFRFSFVPTRLAKQLRNECVALGWLSCQHNSRVSHRDGHLTLRNQWQSNTLMSISHTISFQWI